MVHEIYTVDSSNGACYPALYLYLPFLKKSLTQCCVIRYGSIEIIFYISDLLFLYQLDKYWLLILNQNCVFIFLVDICLKKS